jgi:hypothetical protein
VSTAVPLILIVHSQIARSIDPDQPFRYFSWTRFVIVAAIYTAVAFWLGDRRFPFFGKSPRWELQVLLVHSMFLAILLGCLQICTVIVPSLPFWMTDTYLGRRGVRSSFVECVLYFSVFGMAFFERWQLYREGDKTFSSSETAAPDSRADNRQ